MAQLTIQQAFELAVHHHQSGRLNEAENVYRQILAQEPGLAEAHSNLGNVLKQKGMLDEAIAACRQAIALKMNLAQAHSNLGDALKDKGLTEEALGACRRAVAINPGLAESQINLGNVLKDMGELDEAIAAYRQAIALRPGYAEAYNNLGNVLRDSGEADEAIAAYRRAIELKAGYAQAYSNLLYTMQYHPGYSAAAIAEEHRRWNAQFAEPLRRVGGHANARDAGRRIRIGYISPDFRDHVVGRNLLPLFRRHDLGAFEIHCYAETICPDAMTGEFGKNAGRWRDIEGWTDEGVAEQVRQDEIDILVDLTLHMGKNRLLVFARKPAPVQVTFAGYPASTGLTAIDYRLSDRYLDPVGMDESVHSEKTVRLPDSFWCYDPLDCEGISVGELPAKGNGVVTFGCLNNFCKVNDGVLGLWGRVLREVEGSRMVMMASVGSHRARCLERFRQEGVDSGRVEFVGLQSRQKYLETYHRIDVGLDTFPYNGHTTSLDSFWMGVPVVTRVGKRAVARAGWCQLSNLGMAELAGETEEEFVRIAVELGRDVPRMRELRATLRGRMERSPLMDAAKFARSIEGAYREMWRGWCEGSS